MKINKILLISLFMSASLYANVGYQKAFESDAHWPTFVTPQTDIAIEKVDDVVLKSRLRLVLVRAYEDGKLAVTGREGTFLIDYSKTDFIKQVNQSLSSEDDKQLPEGSFISQIGRRVYSPQFHEIKVIPEKELIKYDEFLVCRINSNDKALKRIFKAINKYKKELNEKNICPIILFRKTLPNEDFYNLLKRHNFPYYTVIPMFTKGFTDTEFTERESDVDFLLLKRSGKLIFKGESIKDIFRGIKK